MRTVKIVTKKKHVNKFWLLYLLPRSAYCGLYVGKEGGRLLDKVGYCHCGHRCFGRYLLFISIVTEHLGDSMLLMYSYLLTKCSSIA